ncbi:MAG: YceD family protein [Methylophilus sp.]|nr:YceD family protein [Methylophilus sp.]
MKTVTINNLDFALKEQVISDAFPISSLIRLSELLNAEAIYGAEVRFQLSGHSKSFRLPSLHLQLAVALPMICQRCLEAMEVPLNLNFDYVISDIEPIEDELIDDLDWLEASHNMDVIELIEDELLIALPIAPIHTIECKELQRESGEKPNPFAVLKGKF